MISIIIPVYKSEKTLERCVKSVMTQTYSDIEGIMVVNGPLDASGRLAETLQKTDRRLRVVYEEKKGVSAARNAGIEAAQGDFIQFLDSDDYLEPAACEELRKAMNTQKCDFVLAGFHHWFYGKKRTKLPGMEGPYSMEQEKTLFLQLYEKQFMNMPWNKLYRKELIKKGFSEEYSLGEDLLFNLDYIKSVREMVVVNKPVCNYIQDGRGTTLSTRKREDRMETALYLLQRVSEFYKEKWGSAPEAKKVFVKKTAVEFLDAMEELAMEKGSTLQNRIPILKEYKAAFTHLPENMGSCIKAKDLPLLDYKILFFFFEKGALLFTSFLIGMRGMIVKLCRGIR